ncbi:hypothetical protein SAMN05192561_101725 [Halopenitus malekzadehii]|uniref:Uncharacterized protein n=1 Tax=Halopenitus malekzadehii TaxID=1267564 RepID=A0A1H6I317_9EURY|nr:hypothetical protein SAMN05192561_101725 [Halopenitus malekzadehii]
MGCVPDTVATTAAIVDPAGEENTLKRLGGNSLVGTAQP